jgi:hypothetical protein
VWFGVHRPLIMRGEMWPSSLTITILSLREKPVCGRQPDNSTWSYCALDPLHHYMRVGAGDRSEIRVGEDALRICAVHVKCANVQSLVP